ncbi:TPA: hypothetical protein ACYFQD_004883 [Klebsiella pneumoniae]|nr:hypothetical protein [Klebsiella pneumoniae]MCJ3656046.1 hypothetical protein [Klebsiella pneumoniae]MCU9903718.1 hypothetical protein [Klebsiella pneumoniae]USP23714.1 hypothetical protein K6036_14000 [Klebsiella pneumoniae]WKG54313.1 hypothetical protein QYQ83_07015 [Klebsiella pneumoniae]HEN1573977.1 hypothetical protein [Klebsiella pneumoniae]
MGEISVKTGNNARNGGKNSLNRLIRCVCGKKIGPDPRNFNQRVSLGRNDLLIRTFLNKSILIVITHLYYVNAIYYFNNTIEVAMLLLGLNSFITNVIGLVIKKRAILLA